MKFDSFSTIFRKDILQKNQPLLSIILLCFGVAAFISYYTTASFLRYDNFYTGRLDLGNMTQTVWNTAHGRFFQLTNPDGTETLSRLAFHADFILVLFAPFYWIWESPKVLLLLQVVIVGMGAFFVYFLANTILKNKILSLTFAFVYLLYPPLAWSVLFDFHAVVLATTFLLATTYFLIKKKYILFIVFALLAALTKEQVWFVIALFGPLIFFGHKKRLLGSLVFFFSLGIFYFLLWYAIPHAAATQGHFALSYFDNAGSSPSDLIKQSIFTPHETVTTLLQTERLNYLQALFMPLGYLSLLFPQWLLFAGADFALNLLSDKEELHSITYHYTAIITPFIFLCAIYSVRKVKKTIMKNLIALYLLVVSSIAAFQYGPLPSTQNPNDQMFISPVINRKEIQAKLDEIPEKNSVASTNELGAHLSHREHIYTMGIDVTEADYIAFFTHEPDPSEDTFNNELKKQLNKDHQYSIWYNKYNVTIYKKTEL